MVFLPIYMPGLISPFFPHISIIVISIVSSVLPLSPGSG
jgi:hypothetical protein